MLLVEIPNFGVQVYISLGSVYEFFKIIFLKTLFYFISVSVQVPLSSYTSIQDLEVPYIKITEWLLKM